MSAPSDMMSAVAEARATDPWLVRPPVADRAVFAAVFVLLGLVAGPVGLVALAESSKNSAWLVSLAGTALLSAAACIVLAVRAWRLRLVVTGPHVEYRGLIRSGRFSVEEPPTVRPARLLGVSPNSPLVLVLHVDGGRQVTLLATLSHTAAGRAEVAGQVRSHGWRGDTADYVRRGF